MRLLQSSVLTTLALLLNGCTHTFGGTMFVVTPGDIVMYLFIALVLGGIAFLLGGRSMKAFWICFIVSILLTPIIGVVSLIIVVRRKNKLKK